MAFPPRRFVFPLLLIAVIAAVLLSWRFWFSSGGGPAGRILLVAMDGADWQHIDPLVARGELPTFARLREEGASGVLHSLRGPMMSPVIWTTVATGKGPLEHGIRSYTVPDPETGADTQVTSTLRRSKALWNILTEEGLRVSTIGWSVTWPAEPVSGELISSFLPFAPEGAEVELSRLTYPESLAPEMMALRVQPEDLTSEDLTPFVGELEESELTDRERGELGVLLWAISCDETFCRAAGRLLPLGADLTAVFVGGVDKVGHHFMKYHAPEACHFTPRAEVAAAFGGVLEAYYRHADRLVARLLADAGPETILILVSDHGFAARPVEEIELGWEWHRREGVVLIWGPGVRRGVTLPPSSVFDITPTILCLLGLPQAEDMRGNPITAAFESRVTGRRLPAPVESYQSPGWRAGEQDFVASPQGDKELELLRSLGYIR